MAQWASLKAGALLASAGWAATMPASVARASTYHIVYTGSAGIQGVLAVDSVGNLYGEAAPISGSNAGSVFELTLASEYARGTILYAFGNGGSTDGSSPSGGVTLTAKNVILGTTAAGGIYNNGTIFDLGTRRAVALTALHAFSGNQAHPIDGSDPQSGLTLGLFNHYYGTTTNGGGTRNGGTVFSVTSSPTNPKYQILHSFGSSADGSHPQTGRLAIDSQGRLYGTTMRGSGGSPEKGTVFMLQYVDGGWQEQDIYNFETGNGFLYPEGNVVLDGSGNVYGCAQLGARFGHGGVYELTPPAQAGGTWGSSVVYYFGSQADDPVDQAECNLAIDPATNLIVGSSDGGGADALGTLFTLTPPSAGQSAWIETVVHSFAGGADGAAPTSPPLKVNGTYYGGNSGNGSIYAFTP